MSKPTLTLIDGSGYLYRAFHALPPLSNRSGEPTGALFGVVNMLRATLKAKPDYAAFVADAPGPTFRDDLYADYKANRAPMPDELLTQIEPMLALVGALGFPILRVPGVEADDVIGTLATQAAAQGIDVIVSTGDKDLAQLVNPQVKLVNTMSNTTLDEAGVVEKFGVRADQIADYLALMGDNVDNVPGVEKCGPKTAAKWLAEYGTLDGVIANADKIGGKIGENLRAALPRLPLSRELTIVKTDVPLDVKPSDLSLREPDTAKLRELYARYEFSAALKELGAAAAPAANESTSAPSSPPAIGTDPASGAEGELDERQQDTINPALSAKGDYELVLTEVQLDEWLARLNAAELVCIDTETTGLDPMRAEIVGVSFAVEPGRAAYVPLAHDYPGAPAQLGRDEVLEALRPLLQDAKKYKLGQHLKYDMNVLSNYG